MVGLIGPGRPYVEEHSNALVEPEAGVGFDLGSSRTRSRAHIGDHGPSKW
jgi:hypothetical protein